MGNILCGKWGKTFATRKRKMKYWNGYIFTYFHFGHQSSPRGKSLSRNLVHFHENSYGFLGNIFKQKYRTPYLRVIYSSNISTNPTTTQIDTHSHSLICPLSKNLMSLHVKYKIFIMTYILHQSLFTYFHTFYSVLGNDFLSLVKVKLLIVNAPLIYSYHTWINNSFQKNW